MLLVYITFPNFQEAEKVGEALVKDKLAACVNILPKIKSIYIWKDEFYKEDESVLLAKIKDENYPSVEKRVKALHPYELPAIFALKVEKGLKEFLDWIEGS